MEKLFAVSAPGLEPYTALELVQMGMLPPDQRGDIPEARQPVRTLPEEGGGINFTGDLRTIYLANLHLRTANRVLVRLGEFYAAAFSELRKKASRLAWGRYLRPGQPVAINVTCHHSRLYHSDAVAERIVGAIGDCLGQLPQVMKSDSNSLRPEDQANFHTQLVVVRLVHDLCTISIDSSGELLHRRGYRLATAKAPVRETLAAGMLLASGWDRVSPLVDPFCGSGTIAIEAAMMALGIAPGCSRRFAFMGWQDYDPTLWDAIVEENRFIMENQKRERQRGLKILASDRDAGAVQIAQANASRIGVEQDIEFLCQAVSAIEPVGTGWVVTNPPYGLRVSASKDLRDLYAQFGKVLRTKCPEWHVAILCNDIHLLRNTGLQFDTSLALVNGGLSVRLACGVVGV
jgi:putative N6-adenine-specific DNA methylase